MDKPALYCEHCGARLPLDASFCEQCGSTASIADPFESSPALSHQKPFASWQTPFAPAIETIVGHIPVDYHTTGRWGRTITRQGELLITTQRLLFLHDGFWTDDERWFLVQNEWEQALGGEIDEVPVAKWRAVADNYDFAGPDWAELYATPPDKLLVANKHNFTVIVGNIASAVVTMDDQEQDLLDLVMEDGGKYHFMIFMALGRPCARFLQQALGPARVVIDQIH